MEGRREGKRKKTGFESEEEVGKTWIESVKIIQN